MAQDMKVLVMHDNQDVLRDITVILKFLGEDVLTSSFSDWKSTVDGAVEDSSHIGVVFMGGEEQAVEPIVAELDEWDEGIPVLAIGEVPLDGLDEVLRRKVIASIEFPPDYNKTLDSLYRAQVFRDQYSLRSGRGKQRQALQFPGQ